MINKRIIIQILAAIIGYIGLSMLVPFVIAIFFHEKEYLSFLYSSLLLVIPGFSSYFLLKLTNKEEQTNLNIRDGFLIVTLAWIVTFFVGTLPYIISGAIPNFTDAFFETASGFTTTGASILTDIESLPKSILFWRSLTHWVGGVGIVVVAISVMPLLGVAGMQLFKAETPGPTTDKLTPRVKETARIIGLVYVLITFFIFLLYLICGMSLFDAICHAFGTIATGGFSPFNSSIGYYKSSLIEYVVIFCMFIPAVNFSLHYAALKGSFRSYLKSEELKWFVTTILASTLIISMFVFFQNHKPFEQAFRSALFNVVSLISTTGFGSEDYEKWSHGSQILLITLMYLGGMVGSTSGGIKQVRFVVVVKLIIAEIKKHIHPQAIVPIRLNGEAIDRKIATNILIFTLFYALVSVVAVVVLGFSGVDVATSVGAVAACINGVGPGIGLVGPTENYYILPALAKWVLTACMLLGRLEIFTILVLFSPTFWKR
jgi:trk system potassium uptake protein TrkH